jgi:hypothetical protein
MELSKKKNIAFQEDIASSFFCCHNESFNYLRKVQLFRTHATEGLVQQRRFQEMARHGIYQKLERSLIQSFVYICEGLVLVHHHFMKPAKRWQ